MGLHFHEWIDYNGIAFSMELLEEVTRFEDFGVFRSKLENSDK